MKPAILQWMGKNADVAMVAAVLGVMAVLFVPIPSALLDFLILSNFSFAFLILLLTFYVGRPVEFSTFPSLLLVATLFRLSLNVAATRLILADGDAGRVIAAIGAYVVGGNYVIGLIVFFILIVVQYVVITSGAQRVSEVAARFTLDSMPGQQMSIDADLNMGFIDQEQAQRRRKNLEKESGFYGAMDGASKFVKGDAIAGIVILLINIVGGLIIGMTQKGLPWAQALQTYTLLTIGDGIVTQVPALVIALGTGIIVTRSSADANLSREAMRQMTSFPKILLLAAGLLSMLLVLPGLPAWPVLILLGGVMGLWWCVRNVSADSSEQPDGSKPSEDKGEGDLDAALKIEPVEVQLGAAWAVAVKRPESPFSGRMAVFRQQHAQEMGQILPEVRLREVARLPAERYEIHLDGAVAARGELRVDRLLAIHPAGDMHAVAGEATREPTYGLPALWIEPSQRAAAVAARYTVVEPEAAFMTHLTETLRRESASLLTRAETERLLERARNEQAGLVEELIPAVLAVGDVQKVLQSLLREGVSIRHMGAILETLADAGRHTKDIQSLNEAVRQRLGNAICQQLAGEGQTLHVMTLDPALEGQLMQSLNPGDALQPAALETMASERLLSRLIQHSERMMKSNLLPVLLCTPELRRHLRSLSARLMPHLRVLAMTEVPPSIELKSYAVVGVHDPLDTRS